MALKTSFLFNSLANEAPLPRVTEDNVCRVMGMPPTEMLNVMVVATSSARTSNSTFARVAAAGATSSGPPSTSMSPLSTSEAMVRAPPVMLVMVNSSLATFQLAWRPLRLKVLFLFSSLARDVPLPAVTDASVCWPMGVPATEMLNFIVVVISTDGNWKPAMGRLLAGAVTAGVASTTTHEPVFFSTSPFVSVEPATCLTVNDGSV